MEENSEIKKFLVIDEKKLRKEIQKCDDHEIDAILATVEQILLGIFEAEDLEDPTQDYIFLN